MKGGYKIIDFKHIPLSDAEHPVLVPDLRTVLDENYGKAVLLTNVVLGVDSMDDCFSTVVLKSNGRIKLNSYDGYITVDSDSYAHYTEGSSGDPTAEIEEIKEDIQDIQSDIGDLNDLSTEEKTSLVGSVNEVNGKVDDVSDDLGNLSDLNTTDKSSAVAAINEVNTKVSKTEDLISIVENGNTCTHTGGISAGQYVNWKGNLYTADINISVGATFADSGGSKNLTAVVDGGLNDIKNSIAVTTGSTQDGKVTFIRSGIFVQARASNFSLAANESETVPSGFRPKYFFAAPVFQGDEPPIIRLSINEQGTLFFALGTGTRTSAYTTNFTVVYVGEDI